MSCLDTESFTVGPGHLPLMRPGMTLRHDWGYERSFQSFIVFDFEELGQAWPALSAWPLSRDFSGERLFFDLWRQLLALEHAPGGRSGQVTFFAELLLRLTLEGGTRTPARTSLPLHDAVARALDVFTTRLRDDPGVHLSLQTVASLVGMSAQHLCRLFLKDLELEPIECFQLLKIEQVASRIERTSDMIAEIADAFGFSSQF